MKLQQFLLRLHRVANHDFCPGCNRLTGWLKQPIGWVVSAIAFSLLVGLLIGPQGYVLAFSFFALLVLGLAWPYISMKGVQCHLLLPDRRVEENEELELVFRVRNFWPLPIYGLMVKGEFLQEPDGEEEVAFSLRHVRAWSESEFRISIIPGRRGKLPSGKVFVTNGFPFGLTDIAKAVDVNRPVIVWPNCVPLEGLPMSDSNRFCLQGVLRNRAGHDGDSIGVRDFRTGDRLKNIHWAQSARSQKLMVRERQSVSSAGVTVLIDLSPDNHIGSGVNSTFEWTIRIAASVCNHLHETASPVRIICLGLPGRDSLCEDNRNGLRQIMDFLANLPTHSEASIAFESKKEQQSDSTCSFSNSSDGHLFVIGSSQSSRIQSLRSRELTSNVTTVIVDMDGFLEQDEYPSPAGTASPLEPGQNRSVTNESISIQTPQSAAGELASGWSRSFSDAI